MNEELEKNFLEEIKPLIDDYERYVDQEMPYSSVIEVNKYKQYADDEEGKILQSIDEELEKLVVSKMAELTQAREKKIQQKREEIYAKTQEFVDKSKEEVNKEIEEKNKQLQEKEEKLKKYAKKIRSIKDTLNKIEEGKKVLLGVDDPRIYEPLNEVEKEKMDQLKEQSRLYVEMLNDYDGIKDEVHQLEEREESFDKIYGRIDFISEDVIDDILKIIKEQQEKDLSNKSKNDVNNPKTHKTLDDVKVTSLEELEKKRKAKEEQNTVIDNQEDEVDEEKRKLEEEQMWEEYKKEQEEQRQQDEKEEKDILEQEEEKRKKEEEKEAKRIEEIDEQRNNNKEEQEKRQEKEKKIREKKEEFFNKKEKGYEDLLEEDLPYQALKERLINTYALPQLGKALNKKSLVEIYELYVKQVIKDLENAEIIEEGLTEEELNAKIEEKLENEELKTTLSVRLEMLKGREKEIKEREKQLKKERQQHNERKEQATKFFENIEKKYGMDILPRIYFKDKTDLIDKYAKGENTELLSNFKLLEYCEEQLKILEINRDEPTVKAEEVIDYNDLQDKIQSIREKALELGEMPPYMQEIKEKLENFYSKSEEGYKDLLPTLYYDFKEYQIKMNMLSFMNDSTKINEFLDEYEEKYENMDVNETLNLCKAIDNHITDGGDYTKGNGELATNEEIYELRNAIQQIEKRKYIKENAYKETKIVVEPYNDRIMVYLEGEVKPREFNKLEQRMKDGQNSYKNGHIEKGLVKGVEKGNFAIVSVLQQLKVETSKDFLEGYTHMFAKNPEVASKINSVVYDFSNENGKIQSQKMIKEMKKYAKDAEKYGVAESIGRKEGIAEKVKDGIGSFFGKGKEKVLALGEGIKGFDPIGNAIENRKSKKYSKDKEVDRAKATSTYNEWEDNQNKAYNDLIARIRQNVPTEEEQAEYIEKLKNEQVFKDRRDTQKESETEYNRREDEFYDMYGG